MTAFAKLSRWGVATLALLCLTPALAQGARAIDVDGRTLHAMDRGEGRPILFVHGWLGSGDAWSRQMAYFAASHRVVALDLTGFGDSDKPDVDAIEYDHALWDADIAAVIEQLDLDDVVLVGHSSGASSVVSYAARHPERVSALVLIDSIPLAPSEISREQGSDFSAMVLGGYDGFVEGIAAAVLSEPQGEPFRADLVADARRTSAEIAVESYWNWLLPDRRPLLDEIGVPTLVIHGSDDAIIPLPVGRALAQSLANAELHVIPRRGHAPHMTHPDLVNVLIRRFLGE